jgi:hypothetical protein
VSLNVEIRQIKKLPLIKKNVARIEGDTTHGLCSIILQIFKPEFFLSRETAWFYSFSSNRLLQVV